MTPVLRVHNLTKYYPVRGAAGSVLHAADEVSFEIMPGETLALVGESGSGKSTVGKCILRLEEPTAGEVALDGVTLTALPSANLRRARQHIQIVFQDPAESLNPRMRVGDQVAEPLWLYGLLPRVQTAQRVRELFTLVGLLPDTADQYPHQLSGGQQQRVAIARALATDPKVVVLDEPTSALDVSVQAQLILLLRDLQQRLGMAYLFISHDLALVRSLAHRVAVMYLGQIVEVGDTAAIFTMPRHPYTRALISATPTDDPRERKRRLPLLGEPPTPVDPAPVCRLAGRCPFTRPECMLGEIALQDIGDHHPVRCIRYIREHRNGVWNPTAEVEVLPAQAAGAEGVR